MAYPNDLLDRGFTSRMFREGTYRRYEFYEWTGGDVPRSGQVYGLNGIPIRGASDPDQPAGMEGGVLLEAGVRESLARGKAIIRLEWGTPRGDFAGFGSQLGTWSLDPITDSSGSARIEESLRLRGDIVIAAGVETYADRDWNYVRPQWVMSYRNATPGESKDVMNRASSLYGRIAIIRGVPHILLNIRARDRSDGLTDIVASFWSNAQVPSFPAGTIEGYPYDLPALSNLDSYLVAYSPADRERVFKQDAADKYGDIVPPSQWNLIGVDNLG